MNSYKISEKKICIQVGISTRDQNGLQSSQRYTIHGRGSRVYPNVGAAGCTLTSGQPGAAWSGQEVCSGFALAACCMNWYDTICIKSVRIPPPRRLH